MGLRDNINFRLFKAYIKYEIRNGKRYILSLMGIIGGISLFNIFMSLAFIFTAPSGGWSNINSGVLMTGFFTAIVMAAITSMVRSGSRERNKIFTFPLTRKIYGMGNLATSFLLSFSVLVVLSVMAILELSLVKVLSSVIPNMIFINRINMGNFISGFIISFAYIFALVSWTYCMGMCFSKYKMSAIITGAILVAGSFSLSRISPGFKEFILGMFKFYFTEESMGLCFIKLIITGILFHGAAYIPLRNMEVKA